jgi:hypothetical protein
MSADARRAYCGDHACPGIVINADLRYRACTCAEHDGRVTYDDQEFRLAVRKYHEPGCVAE